MRAPARERHDRAGLHRELPAGLGDLLPDAAARFFDLRRTLLAAMERWGYRPTVPPLLEYGEVFSRALADTAEEVAVYKLVDRTTGHVLAIRPDFTPQIARMVASRFAGASLPLRLCYEGPVLRHVPAQQGRSREIHQVGAELLGVLDPEADAEAIALAIGCLAETGVRGFKIDVGQVEFFRGILLGCDLGKEQAAAVTDCVARKDASELGLLLEDLPIPDTKKRLLAELPFLAGGTEVLDRATGLVESDHSRAALENLAQVVDYVGMHGLAERLTVDLGELRGIDYHSGVIFEAFVHQVGSPLCRGGRYDRLLALYGLDLPATGCALDLLAVTEALRLQGESLPPHRDGVFIVNFRPSRSEALGLARRLRARSTKAARDLIRRPLEDSLAYAREQGFRWGAVLGGEGCPADGALLVDLPTGGRRPVTLDELLQQTEKE
ncbi:MAG: ATP phosphoribosyltransferase regulatory subunit [Proteobacteria bacterium]|nr:ATP phosphoribosyltransferase regulatory subunit [Pseudomonadota bacterium]